MLGQTSHLIIRNRWEDHMPDPTPEEVEAARAVFDKLLKTWLDSELEVGPVEVDAARVLSRHFEAIQRERERGGETS